MKRKMCKRDWYKWIFTIKEQISKQSEALSAIWEQHQSQNNNQNSKKSKVSHTAYNSSRLGPGVNTRNEQRNGRSRNKRERVTANQRCCIGLLNLLIICFQIALDVSPSSFCILWLEVFHTPIQQALGVVPKCADQYLVCAYNGDRLSEVQRSYVGPARPRKVSWSTRRSKMNNLRRHSVRKTQSEAIQNSEDSHFYSCSRLFSIIQVSGFAKRYQTFSHVSGFTFSTYPNASGIRCPG